MLVLSFEQISTRNFYLIFRYQVQFKIKTNGPDSNVRKAVNLLFLVRFEQRDFSEDIRKFLLRRSMNDIVVYYLVEAKKGKYFLSQAKLLFSMRVQYWYTKVNLSHAW